MGEIAEEQRRLAALDSMLENVPDPMILVGDSGLVEEANASARALFPSMMVGRPLSYGLRAPEILAAIGAARTTLAPATLEYRERVPHERAFAVQISAVPRGGNAAPEPSGVMLFFRDLTEAHRLERMRVDFVANVSHELRTPLASLIGFIETLQGPARADPASHERFLDIMRGQAWRMTRLIDDLLSLSRIELREHLAPNAAVDLRLVVKQMVDTLRPMARDRGVEIAVEVFDEPATVLGETDELLRVVENLVENAVKYGQGGERVEVAVFAQANEVELSVRDYGPGISHEHLPRLTERFYRVDVAASRDKGGTGLGLAIVKHIVSRHRGRLAIESEPGHGAVFRVLLPRHGVNPAGA